MAVLLHNPVRGAKKGSRAPRRSKGRFGMPLGPYAEELSAGLLIKDYGRALSVLMRAAEAEWKLPDIEEFVIAAAVTRLGELWLRGRLSDNEFEQVGALAERVEVAFRHRLVNRRHLSLRSSSQSPATD
jgi:hypothetical protein